MRKLEILIVIASLFMGLAAQADWVTVPDKDFETMNRSLEIALESTKFSDCSIFISDNHHPDIGVQHNSSKAHISYRTTNEYGNTESTVMRAISGQPVLKYSSKWYSDILYEMLVFTDEAGTSIIGLDVKISNLLTFNEGTISKPKFIKKWIVSENFSCTAK